MPQQTFTEKLSQAEQKRFRAELEGGDFEFRSVDHAHFSARGEGVVATLYRSGKLVVQGASAELFVERYLGRPGTKSAPERRATDPTIDSSVSPEVGGDESGKGDYFGPLVVAAIRIGPGDAAKLKQGGVMDSKKVTDTLIRRTAPVLREHYAHALRVLDPPEYNRRHAETGNVAILLSDLYRELVEELAQPGDRVVIDQFSKHKGRLEGAMKGLDVSLAQMHRAERHPSVAAASFLAREGFLARLAELGEEAAVDLPKGAGPLVLTAARRFVAIHGEARLGEVAKLHFKTTLKVVGRAR
jgi:ribonuclease HIII